MRFICIYIFFVVAGFEANAQAYQLEIKVEDGKKNELITKKFGSEATLRKFVSDQVNLLHASGYLEASSDSLIKTGDKSYSATIIKGAPLKIEKIKPGNLDPLLIQVSGIEKYLDEGKYFYAGNIKTVAERILRYYENHGHPFASVKLDSISMVNNRISGSLTVEKGKYYKIDSIVIKGMKKVPVSYLYNYIGIKPGDLYHEESIQKIDTRLKEISFLQIIKPSEILFTENNCYIYLYVKKRNASNFNGIVGLLPDNTTGKITISGDARIILRNAFSRGELLDLNWRKLANKTQDLKTVFNFPFLFKTPFGTELALKLFKRDTSFIELNKHIAVSYHLKRGNFFKVFYNQYTSNVLSLSSFNVTSSNLLSVSDVTVNSYGVGFKTENLDYRINPRKGYSIQLEGSAGFKTIAPNPSVNEEIYSGLDLKTEQLNGNATIDFFIPVMQNSTIRLHNKTMFIINQKIFTNELIRFGGIRTLRGFDEESIFATGVSIFGMEFRYLLEENSNIYLFADGAWYENNASGTYVSDTPFGFGAGVNFQVKAGIFSLNYALGKQFNNPILLRNSKVHFGFISYF